MEYSKHIKTKPWLKITRWDIVIGMGTNNSPRKCNLYTSFQLNSNTTSRTKVDVNAAPKLYLI